MGDKVRRVSFRDAYERRDFVELCRTRKNLYFFQKVVDNLENVIYNMFCVTKMGSRFQIYSDRGVAQFG